MATVPSKGDVINLKLAFRTLFKSPFVTGVAIVSLALGIGANAAIFSLFHQILLQPLAVSEPSRLVNLAAPGPKQGNSSCNNAGGCDQIFTYPMFRDLERAQTVFTGIAAHRLFDANLAFDGQTVNGQALLVSGSYFPVLGLQPSLGRLLGPADDKAIGQSAAVVLSYSYWQTRLGASPSILDKTMVVNGQTMTIVGVAPEGFNGTTLGARPKVFVPITMRASLQPWFKGFDDRKNYWAYLFARLKPEVSITQARTALNVPYHAVINDVEAPLQKMSEQTLARFRARQVMVEAGARGQSGIDREARSPLNLLLGVAGIVLLIACANIANLLLARGAARAGEMSVRLSIGASRRQLITQLLTEACVLAAFGGMAGLLVARWTLDLMASLLPADAAQTISFDLDRAALLFAAGITLGTGLLFGLFPALHATRPDLMSTLKGQAGQPSGARSAKRFRATLATSQIALSMGLLVFAGLFTKSLINVSRVDLGVKIDHVVTFAVSPELNGYKPKASQQLFERLEDELAALPGVNAVADARVPLLGGDNWGNSVKVQGFQGGPDVDTNARFNEIGPGYFQTLGIPMIAGRDFTRADALGSQKVAIVNEAFARKFNLGRDPLGKRIGEGASKEPDIEIVGFVRDAKYSQVKGEIPPVYFRPYRQDDQAGVIFYYVRTALDPEQTLGSIPKVVAALDANLPVQDLRTMPQQVRENVFLDRFLSVLSTAFAVLATLLAAVGLYGVLAYTVAQRTREFGLRMALGAQPGRVRAMILGQLGVMTIIGGTVGLLGAVGIGRLAQSMLFQLQGSDPVVLIASVALLSLVAFGAGLIPAHRASRVDPMRALRYE
jgi:putative ABC transport system permease protein